MEKRWVRHILFWLVYLAFEAYTEFEWIVRQYKYSISDGLFIAFTSETALVVLIKIPMVYILFWLMSLYANKKISRWKTIFSMSVNVVFFTLLARMLYIWFLDSRIYTHHELLPFFDFQGIMDSFMDKIFIAGVAIALRQHSISQQFRDRETKLIKEKLEAELNFLKSQVNPHFLFNTLNNIYSLARKKSDNTADVVVRLSKLLRFMLYETQHDKVAIEKEIHFLSDYIELEKIRYGKRLSIDFHSETDDNNAGILPLILIPFVENAFKHGAGETTDKAVIGIYLKLSQKKLYFKVENTFEVEENLEVSEGIGLKNLRRQLELRYPDFDLKTAKSGTVFKATLEIDLNKAP